MLTNNHVVQGASSITAVMSDGDKVKARIVGTDPLTDIAVVKLDADPQPAVAMLGTAESLKVGQLAVAIGSPLGLAGGPSVTVGVVSAIGRQVDGGDGIPLLDMIQTDAPIAPGSSGGALVDASGEVIGITTALAVDDSGPRGLGFATPVDVARTVGRPADHHRSRHPRVARRPGRRSRQPNGRHARHLRRGPGPRSGPKQPGSQGRADAPPM